MGLNFKIAYGCLRAHGWVGQLFLNCLWMLTWGGGWVGMEEFRAYVICG